MVKRNIFLIYIFLFCCNFIMGNDYIPYTTDAPSVTLELNNQKFLFLIDTGGNYIYYSVTYYKKTWNR